MLARQIMTRDVVTAAPDTSVKDLARLLIEHRISGMPVVDADRRVVGMITEGDLMFRAETGAKRSRSRWAEFFTGDDALAREFLKSHARRASEVMTKEIVAVDEDATAGDVAKLLEERHIKRVPVLRGGRLVGIISRADLVRALAMAAEPIGPAPSLNDEALKDRVAAALRKQPWTAGFSISVHVSDGAVHLWGFADSEAERTAARVLAEQVAGVRRVENHLRPTPAGYYGGI